MVAVPKLDGRKTTHSFFADDLIVCAQHTRTTSTLMAVADEQGKVDNTQVNWEKSGLLRMDVVSGTKTKHGCLKEVYGGAVKDDQLSKRYMGLLVQHDGKFNEQVEVAAKKLHLALIEGESRPLQKEFVLSTRKNARSHLPLSVRDKKGAYGGQKNAMFLERLVGSCWPRGRSGGRWQ